ncbi:OLC1v1012739C1 [Oldenlandia corymbosa var. corymbosa]|uniref:OLC1v1012739C1 n=1 Tax=Oldenlandia corymbosa var. corymbosa TaxID=529605 RepID=A0AAV1DWV8_OLDCO|nr:OLC1v1012739C1 [Oldenlandia corymbosa var. corymbosa]
MDLQIRHNPVVNQIKRPISSSSLVSNPQLVHFGGRISFVSPLISIDGRNGRIFRRVRSDRKKLTIVSSSSSSAATPFWDTFVPEKGSKTPSLSDIIWPSAGAFAAMAIFGKVDQMLASKGISITIAPLGAVCAVLFATPSSPGARKYNMFMAQIGCAAIGVLAFTLLGPGWLARSSALSAAIAFMIYTRSVHPPAASLPLLFIDGAKMHQLNYWYALFPGAAGCIILCLIQEVVSYLKDNLKF